TVINFIFTLSLHDALPIFRASNDIRNEDVERGCYGILQNARLQFRGWLLQFVFRRFVVKQASCNWDASANFNVGKGIDAMGRRVDRKSTRLNSSHQIISYA